MGKQEDVSIVIAGEAGQGIQSIEAMITIFAKKASYNVFATKEYMSRVRGGCNSTEIRIARPEVRASVERMDILIPLTAESIPHVKGRITDRTVIIGEKKIVAYDRMTDVPFSAIAAEAGGVLYANTVAVGTLSAILKLDRAGCETSLRSFFSKKSQEIQDANVLAFTKGYERGAGLAALLDIDIPADPSVSEKIMVTGAEAIALGSVAGGCNYVCAYPMSPGTSVLTAMADYSRKFDIVVEQVEDEIGVANMAIGAWYAGARALVTTSGGGFALMSEAVSLAGSLETPFVVHVAQRPGPATGLPTRTEQGDLNLAINAGHGDFLKVVLAPGDLEEGFGLARAAFDIADRYQSPVFILTDQYFVDTYYTTGQFKAGDAVPGNHVVETALDYRRYALGSADGISPRGVPGKGQGIVCVDSDEHTEAGYITEDKAVREAMVAKRLAKIQAVKRDIIQPRLYGDKNFKTLIVAWGSTKRPIIETLSAMGDSGMALLHFPWVYPLPEGIGKYMEQANACVAVEGNATGQFADLVEFKTGKRFDHRILKSDGYQFSVEELASRLSAFAEKTESTGIGGQK
jgi:2-oxoglutarate ferredoxin oxidoreductase subunit alpha